jgi:hypothetical protein
MMGLLMALVIVCAMVAVYLTGGFGLFGETALPDRPDGKGKTTIGRAANRAKDEVCRSNIRSVRMSIQIQQTTDGIPSSLEELPGLSAEFKRCAIEPKEAYVYDPSTGKVTCPHPGHENF